LEVVAKAIYLLNFYSGLSVCLATVWIISGLRSYRKNDTTPTPKLLGFRSDELRSKAQFNTQRS